MFERKTLEVLAKWWAYEFQRHHPDINRMNVLRTLYISMIEMLRRHNPAFRESVFDKASGFDTYFPNDTK